ncbi:hypothetical protein PTTG_26085 [Puccinia triticina 1-1 BBBD Race 1]|uniref:Uncharacterized protein n=1 Tax=Puccinia triticina (isolate 1-1 / race 1 (BBBD)) TaxID=630390 RepID=A0A180GY16_PUCT1|nr:hypothetical protein PTTG_26085 [Puccinia triticina 1-1 BBBD Race 1]
MPAQAAFLAENIPLRGAQNFHHAMEQEFVKFVTATHRDEAAVRAAKERFFAQFKEH